MKADVPLFVEDAEVEIAAMEVDAAGVPVLFLIEAHGSLLILNVCWHSHPAYR